MYTICIHHFYFIIFMIFQKNSPKNIPEPMLAMPEEMSYRERESVTDDEIETVVGPSMNVEGDFSSEGNIIVKGTVTGSLRTSKHLLIEQGARVTANVMAGSIKVAGEVKGNVKVSGRLELTSTARVLGDAQVSSFMVEEGALICGKITMPGLEAEPRVSRGRTGVKKAVEEVSEIAE